MVPFERRAYDRKQADINIEFHCCDDGCEGKASDISQNGMFIRTEEICFPINTKFDIFYNANDKILRIPVKLSRMVRTDLLSGIGISFINTN